MAKGKEHFERTTTFAKKRPAGITLYGQVPEKQELSLNETLEELEKDELRETKKEMLLSRMRERRGHG